MRKALILMLASVIVTSIVGCKVDVKNSGNTEIREISDGKIEKLVDESVEAKDLEIINIDINAADVKLKPYDGDEIKVSGKLSEKSNSFNVDREGNKVNIIEDRDKLSILGSSEDNETKIEILIPSNINPKFVFEQDAGYCYMEGLNLKDMSISGGALKLKISDVSFDKFKLETGAGEADIDIKKSGDIDLQGGVGKVNLNIREVDGNFVYKGGVGDINIRLPKNAPVKFEVEKGVGNYENYASTSGIETYTFDLKMGVGSIIIKN